MKKYKYTVYYANGKKETFYCNSFQSAIILGMAHAIQNGWNISIEYVIDEKGKMVKNIQPPTFSEPKTR